MNSSELASLAGVTVRALRHYHQVGVLEEPPRATNGYRCDDVHDLIHFLRIKRLAALGIPLTKVRDLLDAGSAQAAVFLDQLDQDLSAQIDRLTAQRALIAGLRESNAAPDLPPELAQFLTGSASGLSPRMARMDRDQAVLLAHLVGSDGMAHLVGFYERMRNPELLPKVAAITARFDDLRPETSSDDLEHFVDDFVTAVKSIDRELRADPPQFEIGDVAGLVEDFTTSLLNSTQQRALDLIGARLDGMR